MPIIDVRPNWRKEPCTKLQREYIENRRNDLDWKYPQLLETINLNLLDDGQMPVKDIGELNKGQASLLLDYLIKLCEERNNA